MPLLRWQTFVLMGAFLFGVLSTCMVSAKGAKGVVASVTTPDGSALTSACLLSDQVALLGSENGRVYRWVLAGQKLEPIAFTEATSAPIHHILARSTDEILILRGATLFHWNPKDSAPQKIARLPDLTQTVMTSSGDWIAGVKDETLVQFFETKTGKSAHRVDRQVGVDGIRFSPSGSQIAVSRYGRMYLWETKTGELTWKARLEENIRGFHFSPDGQKIFVLLEDGGFWVLDAQTGSTTQRFPSKIGESDSQEFRHRASISPDTTLLAETYSPRKICIWELMTGQSVLWLQTEAARFTSVTFLADGMRVLTTNSDGHAAVWDLTHPDYFPSVANSDPIPKKILNGLWQRLAEPQGEAAWPALVALKHHPEQALALVKNPPNESGQIRSLITQLDDDRFAIRSAAYYALKRLSLKAEPFLIKTIETPQSAEVIARVRRLLGYLSGPNRDAQRKAMAEAQLHRQIRTIQLLAWINNSEAKTILKTLADESSELEVRRRAIETLKRISSVTETSPSSHGQ